MYEYHCTIRRVVDGDTVDVAIDLGFHVTITRTVRLYGINAPELHGSSSAAGAIAKDALIKLLANGPVTIHTQLDKDDKYGRVLGTFFVAGVNVNRSMVEQGNAVSYMVK